MTHWPMRDLGGAVVPLIPRPPGISQNIDDATIFLACRAYLLGEKREGVMVMLGVTHSQFSDILHSREWRLLQTAFRDEFIDKVGAKVTRIESTILNDLEAAFENGIDAYNMMGDRYHRDLTINEKLKIWQQLQDTQRLLVKVAASKVPDPKAFDRAKKMEELARFAGAQTIDQEKSA